MKFLKHHHEQVPHSFRKRFQELNKSDHKIDVWNAFADSGLSGVNEDDCTILPRLLPFDYLSVIQKTAHDLSLFALRLLSLPNNEIKAIVPSGPIRDFLIQELEVLRFRPERLVGSFRFDMAIVGECSKNNPPKLLELNEIGFDGLFRSSFIQDTLLSLLPDLKKRVHVLDNAASEIQNMKRLGPQLARIQYDSYNWEEEVLMQRGAKEKLEVSLVSPSQFKADINFKDEVALTQRPFKIVKSKARFGEKYFPDSVQMGYSFELADYKKDMAFYQALVRSQTPQYGPFLTGLVASKIILVLLSDATLRRKLLGSANALKETILPSYSLAGREAETRKNYKNCVIKHIDGLGGEMVFMDNDLLNRMKRIKGQAATEWVVQEKTYLNTIDVNGILSRPRKVISDLGVFIQYDWSKDAFNHFNLGGFITRATNRAYTVNVSGGGIQVPVMFLK